MKRIQTASYSKAELKAIRKVLPYRDIGRLAVKLGRSRVHVARVLAGLSPSAPVAEAALEMAVANAQATLALKDRIDKRRRQVADERPVA